ncbi:uncharacterized protein [Rutidosis leptorrhynchoides]|uniref:uncharacterized protein n=1 Tax=Rutidosis leptorrhynchoides TaxID=125765 RepID=UPI003A998767
MRFSPIKICLTLIQKRFLSTSTGISSSPLQKSSSITVKFLINSCGLSSKSALSAAQKLKLDENKLGNPISVIEFLKSNGFEKTQIAKVVEKFPSILRSNVETSLKPKLEYLAQNGYTGTNLTYLIVAHPVILRSSLCKRVKPCLEFLKEIQGSSDLVVKAVRRSIWMLTSDLDKRLKPNIEFLKKGGIPTRNIATLLLYGLRVLTTNPDFFIRNYNSVKELGLDLKSPTFTHVLKTLAGSRERTLKNKCEVYKSLGWTQEDILSMFKKYPSCLVLSEKRIRAGMDYFVKVLKLEPEYVIAHPIVLNHSVDKIGRRYNVLEVLESKKLVKVDRVTSYLTKSDERFKSFISKFEERVPGLLKMYEASAKQKRS